MVSRERAKRSLSRVSSRAEWRRSEGSVAALGKGGWARPKCSSRFMAFFLCYAVAPRATAGVRDKCRGGGGGRVGAGRGRGGVGAGQLGGGGADVEGRAPA